jgi:hypothetical protein
MTHIKEKIITKYMLRRVIHKQLLSVGFTKNRKGFFIPGSLTKEKIRKLHKLGRIEHLEGRRGFIEKYGSTLLDNFASGSEIDPKLISPELIEITSGTMESELFQFATLLWSVPVSPGFGRRMRYLVRDRQNGKLIGIFALGDPVFNLSARDQWIGWTTDDRQDRLIHVMDAYVVGAIPPYSQLIGGKLIASLIASDEIKRAYEKKYLHRKSIISGEKKNARLVLITTTSALGRSSLYNRLSLPGGIRFLRIGMTKGFGHFHLSGEAFKLMRCYLQQNKHPYASGHKFGTGPNWRFRVSRAALHEIGYVGDRFLKHGIEREVYALPLAYNWRDILLGHQKRVRSCTLPASEISEYCLQRWIIPRSQRDSAYRQFNRERIIKCLLDGGPPSKW